MNAVRSIVLGLLCLVAGAVVAGGGSVDDGVRPNSDIPPAGYQAVEYIDCDGGYINTQIYPDAGTRVVFDFQTSNTSDKMTFGERNNGYAFLLWFGTSGGSCFTPAIGSSGNLTGRDCGTSGQRAVFDFGTNGLFVGETELFTAADFKGYVNNTVAKIPLILFGLNNNGSIDTRRYIGKCYGCTFYEGAERIRNYVPCREIGGQERVGLYDTVNLEFKPADPASFKTFAAGPDKAVKPSSTLTVSGRPDESLTVSPAFGTYPCLASGTTVTLNAQTSATVGDATYLLSGYTVYTNATDDASVRLVMTEGVTSSFDLVIPDTDVEVVWSWKTTAPLAVGPAVIEETKVSSATLTAQVTGLGLSAQSATARAYVGFSESDLAPAAADSVALDNAGEAAFKICKLNEGSLYYAKIVVENNLGESVETPVVSFVTKSAVSVIRVNGVSLTGSQVFYTDVKLGPSSTMVLDAKFDTKPVQSRLMSCECALSGYLVAAIYINGSGQFAHARQNGGGDWKASTLAADLKRRIFTYDVYRSDFVIQDAVTGVENYRGKMTGTYTGTTTKNCVTIGHKIDANLNGGQPNPGQFKESGTMTIYGAKFYEAGVLIRDYRPARTADGKVGLFDYVGKTFLPAIGTTSVVSGGDIGRAITSARVAAGQVVLGFDAADSDSDLYCVSDLEHQEGDPGAWARSAKVGTVAAGETSATVELPDGWGETVAAARYYFATDGDEVNYSPAIFWQDADIPSATLSDVRAIGLDKIVLTGSLDSFKGESCTVTPIVTDHTGVSLDCSAAAQVFVAPGEIALEFTGANALTAGETYSVCVELTAGGKMSRSTTWTIEVGTAGELTPIGADEPTPVPVTVEGDPDSLASVSPACGRYAAADKKIYTFSAPTSATVGDRAYSLAGYEVYDAGADSPATAGTGNSFTFASDRGGFRVVWVWDVLYGTKVTVSGAGGTAASEQDSVARGGTARFTATPEPGYAVAWTGDLLGGTTFGNELVLENVQEPVEVVATFYEPSSSAGELKGPYATFAHRTSIVFDGYAGEETLLDFPALVRVSEGSGGFSYAQCVAGGGKDVRFTLADGVELPSEVAEWNPQGESAFWVRLPVLKGKDTRVVMHWGAANPPARELAGSVWSEDYNGVWAFEDEKRALRDSTRRGQHGIASFDSDRSEGVVGKARTFSYSASSTGTSGYMLAGHAHDDVQFKAKVITWECWYRRTGSLDGKTHVLMKTYADGGYKGARVIIGDTGLASVQYDSTAVSGLPSAALDEWHHVMMSVDGVKVYVYTDGVKTAQGNSFVSQDRWWLNSIRDASLVFGFTRSIDGGTYPFAGQLDEAKVSRVCRSQDYALAVYSNVAHNASFLTFESLSGAPRLTVTGDENLPVADATSPAYGVYPADIAVNATAVEYCEQGGTRWVREGYTLSADGKEIASGDGGAVQVNWPDGAKDVVVRWHWRRQYAVSVAGDASCTVEPEGTDWYDAGTALAVTAKVEGIERAFYAWRGNCPTLEVFQAGITLPVDRPRSVTAVSGKAFYAEAGENTLSNAVASVDEYPAVVLAGPGTYTFTHGGGAYIATLTNCIAVRSVGGAAVTVIDGEKADDRCLFKLTSAGAFVGGFTFVNQRMRRDYGNNTPFIVLNPGHVGDCRFVDGVIAGCSSSLVDDKAGGWVRNCIFTGCTSQGSSYGQPYLRVRTAQVEGCKFFDNANTDRAGVNVTHEGTGPSAVFRNCVFARNSAMNNLNGGAVASGSGGAYMRSFVLFENCLFVDNAVKGQGKGGAICSNDGTVNYPGVSLVNCIFDGNTAAGGASFGNDVYGCCSMVNCAGTGIEAENGSMTVAPVFVDRANDDFHVTGLSPTRDAGAAVEQAMTPGAKDLGGAARVVNGKIDIGPYEYEGGAEPFGVNVVPDVAKGTGSLTVTFAVQLAGDTEGVTYDWDFGDDTTSDEAAPVHAYSGGGYFTVRLTVRNGADETATFTGEKLIKVIPRVCYVRPNCENPVEPYVTPETAAKTLADALSVATDTINIDGTVTISAITEILTPLTICGESQTTSVLSVGPVGDNSVFKLTAPGTMLCNLTVKTAGLPYFWNTTPVVAGAGTTVSNCVFTGTGLRPLMLTGGTVVDSVFRNFTSGHDSGTAAITVSAGGSVIDRCIITNNVAGRAGWDYGHRSMGVYVGDAYTPATVIRNSLFANNRGVWNGTPNASQKTTNVCATAVYTKGNTLIENCTVASNTTYQSTSELTAGITVVGAGVEIVNTISWGTVVTNKDVGGVERIIDIAVADGVECDIRRSCATGLAPDAGNVSANPRFRNEAKHDFRIRSSSPCYNAGERWDGIETAVDLDGNPRIRWNRPDMGCYECQRAGGLMLLVK